MSAFLPEIDPGAEKSCNDEKTQEPIDADEPTREGGSAMINKGQILLSKAEKIQVHVDVEDPNGAEQTHLLAIPEEEDASKNPQMKKKKEKKRKRLELQKIKKEQQLGGAEKTQVPVDAEEPASEGGNATINKGHILLSKAEKTQVPVDVEEPNGAEQTHLLAVPEEEGASKNPQMKKKKEKKRKRMELEKIKKEQQLGSAEKTQFPIDAEEPWRWHAFYSTRLLHRRTTKLYEGSILLQAELKRVVLLDTDETVIDAYYLKEGESIHPGSVFGFPCHKVDVGERILMPPRLAKGC